MAEAVVASRPEIALTNMLVAQENVDGYLYKWLILNKIYQKSTWFGIYRHILL